MLLLHKTFVSLLHKIIINKLGNCGQDELQVESAGVGSFGDLITIILQGTLLMDHVLEGSA